jgi:uncharacterized RmlC-like cupin family protein
VRLPGFSVDISNAGRSITTPSMPDPLVEILLNANEFIETERIDVSAKDRTEPHSPREHRLHHIRAGQLSSDTAQTVGMMRSAAISGSTTGASRIWMGQNSVSPGANSGNHHHGESETGIYVVSGHPVFIYAEDGAEVRLATSPGDYVFVPPFVRHREENPNPDEEAVVILSRSTQEAIVENVAALLED